MSKNISIVYLVKNPQINFLCAQIEYMRNLCDEFCFAIDDRTNKDSIDIIHSWEGVKSTFIKWRDDFAWARNQALKLVTNDWTLHLDTDELPSIQAMNHLELVTDSNRHGDEIGYVYWRKNWFNGTKREELISDYHLRLWKSGRGEWYKPVHEQVMIDGITEDFTRGTNKAMYVNKENYIIHSKPFETMRESTELYDYIENKNKRL